MTTKETLTKMHSLKNKFISIVTPSVVTFLLFNRASLDYIRNEHTWMYQSPNYGLRFLSSKNAARIAKVMRRYEDAV